PHLRPAGRPGTGATATTTAGTSGNGATRPQTWPPASQPCAPTTSTPAATTLLASSALATDCSTSPPAACTCSTYPAGSPNESETIRSPASSASSSRAC